MTDPRCPACGEPVGAHATYCMHCGAEFDGAAADSLASRPEGRDRDWLDRWLDPEGVVDDSLTLAVAAVVGVICGFVALVVAGTVGGGAAGLVAGTVAWLGVTGWLARRHSVFGAVHGGCYALAVALVALPVVALTDAAKGGTFGGRVLLFLVAELLFGAVAAVLAGVGYEAGTRRPDPDADGGSGRSVARRE